LAEERPDAVGAAKRDDSNSGLGELDPASLGQRVDGDLVT
jgi:hypothetical protein